MSTVEPERDGAAADAATASPAAAPPPAAAAAASATTKLCANCAAPLAGPYCGQCGQPEKGMIRPLTGMVADLLDSVLGWDSRTWRTLLPLYFRPGFLTNEYLAGRRVRYVTPVRLYLFISVIAFLLVSLVADEPKGVKVGAADVDRPQAHLSVDPKPPTGPATAPRQPDPAAPPAAGKPPTPTTPTTPTTATTPTTPTAEGDTPPDPAALADRIKEDVQRQIAAERELERLKKEKQKQVEAASAASRAGKASAADSATPSQGKQRSKSKNADDDDDIIGWDENGNEQFKFNGKAWDPETNPVKWDGAPDFVNRFFNSQIGKLKEKMPRIKEHPGILFDKLYSLAPQALFVMLPIFALLLKILYLFKRRLYSEHLLVALHSHSFLCLSVMLLVGTTEAHTLLAGSWVAGVFGVLRTLVWIWIPIYLFWMQKRVYRQGWFFTTLKFGVLGIAYTVLLSFGMVGALLVSFLTV